MWEFFRKFGEEQQKAIENNYEILRTIEEHGLGDRKFFGGDQTGVAEPVFGMVIHMLAPMEEVEGGVSSLKPVASHACMPGSGSSANAL
ncbi:hypothetical protein Gohar_008233 [Gossypium harknessii]|uniref:Uncharacterized protein n=1 Tax=Gossypium harknessii TaxID=34285 RepID=A0A7J9GJ12_9ROSI|nr:hypothetical protein [Gossypium harknessii]